MNVTFRRIGAFLLSMIFLFSVIGCGGPKKVDNQEMTLHLVYGDRSGKYTGEVDDSNLPNGKGKFETKNSKGEVWYYEGDFKNGHFEGQGKCVWPATNQIAEGTYVNDRLNGQGKIYNKVNGKEEVKREGNFVAGLLMKAEMVGLNTEVKFETNNFGK